MNRKDSIHITEHEQARLSELPTKASSAAEREHAYVLPWELSSHDVVKMNSTVVYEDETTGKRRTITIVHSRHADITQGRISALAPVGRALLGLAAGESIDWPFPDGKTRRLRVIEVVNQPDAAHRARGRR
ncbi:MAG: GreA/GreB family elongation factor [Pseudomonadota bacterium]|nr:GreA/GreB family elongation factor [Pseudomonadota bacterium]